MSVNFFSTGHLKCIECAMGVKLDKTGKEIVNQYRDDLEEMSNIFIYRYASKKKIIE